MSKIRAGLCVALVLVGGLACWLAVEPPTAQAQFTARARTQSANNLKQIALAFHNYHDVTGSFPPAAIQSKDGKPLLSWRVAILPYIEQEKLYAEFKLDEPWDSEHNKKLVAKMPKLYAPVQGQVRDGTFYQVFVGAGTVFDGAKGIPLTKITDGTSNTLLVVEAGEAVPWSKPADLEFVADKPLPKLGGLFDGNCNAALCDGSVRFFEKNTDEKKLRARITRAGGEVIKD